MYWINLSVDGDQVKKGTLKGGEFLVYMNDYYFLS